MGRVSLGSREVEQLLSFLERGIAAREEVHEFLFLYSRVFHACSASIAVGHGFFPWACTRDVPEAWLATHRRLQAQDPSPQLLLGAAGGSTYRVKSDSTPEVQERPLFRALDGHGYADAAISTVHNPFGAPLFTALYREAGDARFSKGDARLVKVLHPHVARAFAVQSAVDALSPEGPATVTAAQRGARGHAYVLGSDVVWSASGRAFFLEELQMSVTPAALDATLRAELERWRTVQGPRTFRVGGARIDHVDLPARKTQRARTLMLVYDDRTLPARLGPAARLLSPRQRRVVEELATGRTLAESARTLRVSPETVRTHFREACKRLGVSRRSELLARLLER